MSHETDFRYSLERAAGLTLDATCALRTARMGRLPEEHRRRLGAAIYRLESAQSIMFDLKEHPWEQQPPKPEHRQLALM